MGRDSAIEWTHHTFNPWRGCTKVSEGCTHCYADALSKRNPRALGVWGKDGARVVAAESYWREPLAWDRVAADAGERHRVFCASLADVGEGPDTMPDTMPAASWPLVEAARFRLSHTIDATPHLDWLLLSKRPENLPLFFPHSILRRCWIGTSVENQKAADERVPHLLRCPAAVRFLSAEPLLGPIDLDVTEGYWGGIGIDWVIVGGESGPGARPMHPEWARTLRDQCTAAGVAFFFKQWGEWLPGELTAQPPFWLFQDGNEVDSHNFPDLVNEDVDGWDYELEHGVVWRRAGKKSAGAMLDGEIYRQLPARAGNLPTAGAVTS